MGRKGLGGKGRSAQKGKKAWRRINTDDVRRAVLRLNERLAEKSRDERQGLDFERVPDVDLFYVDKGTEGKAAGTEEETAAAPVPAPAQPLSRKEAARSRALRSEAILATAHKARPVMGANPRAKRDGQMKKKEGKDAQAKLSALILPSKKSGVVAAKRSKPASGMYDLWASAPAPTAAAAKRRAAAAAAIRVPAVAVDGPGCSFNPDRSLHAEAVAEAVAAEMKKMNEKDMLPVAPPTTVNYDVEEDELAMLQVDEPSDDEESGSDNDTEQPTAKKLKPQVKKTKTERNRLARRKLVEAALAEARAEKMQRQSIAHVTDIIQDVQSEEQAQAARRERIKADKKESGAGLPPRLGKLKFEPLRSQVLPSNEISGSLRKLKPTSFLAKERFKSLQQRGIIEVQSGKRPKTAKRIPYIRGEKGEREREGHAEIMAARKAGKKA